MENQKNGYYGDSIYKAITAKPELSPEERLKIYVTYKIAIKNQSETSAIITEIVDNFDKKYKYIDSYIANTDGTKKGNITPNNTSIYGTATQYTSTNYNTIYLKPEEITLNKNTRTRSPH